jgi:uncharacterized protein (TIGR02001 family)
MRKLRSLITVVVVFVAVCSPFAFAEDEGLGIDITADFFSKYVWRGQLLNDNYVFQPGISKTFGGLTAGIWGNLDMTGEATKDGDMTEVDYYLDYSGTLAEGIGFSVGVIYYDFPTNSPPIDDTTEVYWGLSFDLPLSPSFTVYHDVDDVDDAVYVSFGIGHSIESIMELGTDTPVGMDIGVSLGWGNGDYNKAYWGQPGSALNDLAFSVAFPFEMGGWSITPSLNYVTMADGGFDDNDSFGTAGDHFFTGISIGTTF